MEKHPLGNAVGTAATVVFVERCELGPGCKPHARSSIVSRRLPHTGSSGFASVGLTCLAMGRSVVEDLLGWTCGELGAVGEHGPKHARVLCGHRNASAVITAPRSHGERPPRSFFPAARCRTLRAPMTSSVRKYGSPRAVMWPRRGLPPVEY